MTCVDHVVYDQELYLTKILSHVLILLRLSDPLNLWPFLGTFTRFEHYIDVILKRIRDSNITTESIDFFALIASV